MLDEESVVVHSTTYAYHRGQYCCFCSRDQTGGMLDYVIDMDLLRQHRCLARQLGIVLVNDPNGRTTWHATVGRNMCSEAIRHPTGERESDFPQERRSWSHFTFKVRPDSVDGPELDARHLDINNSKMENGGADLRAQAEALDRAEEKSRSVRDEFIIPSRADMQRKTLYKEGMLDLMFSKETCQNKLNKERKTKKGREKKGRRLPLICRLVRIREPRLRWRLGAVHVPMR